jgi:hypothetical protein
MPTQGRSKSNGALSIRHFPHRMYDRGKRGSRPGLRPVGQFAIQSAWMFGAGRVIAIDRVPERLEMARTHGKAETLNFDDEPIHERLVEMTGGRGRRGSARRRPAPFGIRKMVASRWSSSRGWRGGGLWLNGGRSGSRRTPVPA